MATNAEPQIDAPQEETAVRNHEPIMQFFGYQHLPGNLQVISKPFGDMAKHLIASLPKNPERTTALRKLLEAKDCAVRAFLFKD